MNEVFPIWLGVLNSEILHQEMCCSVKIPDVPFFFRAVLENHHCSLTFRLTRKDPIVNIFKNLDR